MKIKEQIRAAYKKTKSYVFYDKNLYHIRDAIAELESEGTDRLEQMLDQLEITIGNGEYIEKFDVDVIATPKKVTALSKKTRDRAPITDNESINAINILSNLPNDYEVSEIQYYIDLPLRWFVLGTLWVMRVGSKLDESLPDCNYGNRVKPNTSNSWSPYLFKSYPHQYSQWQDGAIKQVEKCLEDSRSCVFISTDLSKFYYNVNYIDLKYDVESRIECLEPMDQYLTDAVFRIIDEYNQLFCEKKNLPIGFPPSNVLANIYMSGFDRMIITKLTPNYYGRYVDDILIVLNYDLSNGIQNRTDLTLEKLFPCYKELFVDNNLITWVNGKAISMRTSEKKTKVLFLSHDHPPTSITILKRTIYKNSSEFRLMPEDDWNYREDYLEIFNENMESIRRPSEICELTINNKLLSAYLGKIKMLCGLISRTTVKTMMSNLLNTLDNGTLLENHSIWYRLIGIMVSNHDWNTLERFIERLCHIISTSTYVKESNRLEMNQKASDFERRVKVNLFAILISGLAWSTTACWNNDMSMLLTRVSRTINDSAKHFTTFVQRSTNQEMRNHIQRLRTGYCMSRMLTRDISIPIDGFIENNILHLNDEAGLDLKSASKVLGSEMFNPSIESLENYFYRPYILKYSDLCLYHLYLELSKSEFDGSTDPEIRELYYRVNYHTTPPDDDEPIVESFQFDKEGDKCNVTIVEEDRFDNIMISLASTDYPSEDVLKRVIREEPDRSEKRYRSLSLIFNDSCRNGANLVVYPECSIPLDYLGLLTRKCGRNRISMIGGIEYVLRGKKIYNIVVTVLPFMNVFNEPDAYVRFHLKRHYAPSEIDEARKSGYECMTGKALNLFGWNNFWFSTLCCFETCSVEDRTAFKSYVDALIMVEYNRDVNYFSNIVESTVRDLHCYCIQCNNSRYGDSRISRPTSKETMDLIRNKGGLESYVVVEKVSLKDLREFQLTPNNNNRFKPTPPGLDMEMIRRRYHGKMREYMISKRD